MINLNFHSAASPKNDHPLLDQRGNLGTRKLKSYFFAFMCFFSTVSVIGLIGYLILDTFLQGGAWINADFFTNFASRMPDRSGIKAALFGTIWLLGITALFSIPVGVISGIYLEELMKRGFFHKFISVNVSNLAGVPSVVYGIFGLAFFVRTLGFERSLLSGALTLSLMSLPVIIISTREAIAAVPSSIKMGALAMGATKWQTARDHIFPTALPGILTGVILALSRAVGETAPLIILGAVSFIAFIPEGWDDGYTALPMQIYTWVSKPQEEFHQLAAATIIVLLGVLLVANSIAIFIRIRSRKVKL